MKVRGHYCSLAAIALWCRQSFAFSNLAPSAPLAGVPSGCNKPSPTHNIAFSRRIQSRKYSYIDGGELASQTTHLPRLFVDSPSLMEKSVISLTPFQSNYLNVMRVANTKRWGQWAGHVRIFNGQDGEWIAKMLISEASPSPKRRQRKGANTDNTILECIQRTKEQPFSHAAGEVHLYMGRLKKQRRKWVLEKATELGMDSINVVDTEFSTVTDAWEYDKHIAQVIEAAEQCERLTLPQLSTEPTAWSSLIERIEDLGVNHANATHHWLVCRERSPDETKPILSTLGQIAKGAKEDKSRTSIHILVGPEGGWSPGELKQLMELRLGGRSIHFVSLGPFVLRAETAAVAAITATMLSKEQKNDTE
eukprot:scaffold2331_cov126-Cylindrotheca_fusiformis.AAC.16